VILENADKAIIDIRKLKNYCLSKSHPRGRHKAKVFQNAIGFEAKDADKLKLLLHNAINNLDAMFLFQDKFGKRYQIDFEVKNKNEFAKVRSLWIARNEDNHPRLITCYIL